MRHALGRGLLAQPAGVPPGHDVRSVPEHILDQPPLGSFLQRDLGERVATEVRVDPLDAAALLEPADDGLATPVAERPTIRLQPQPVARALGRPSSEILPKVLQGPGREPYGKLPVPLGAYREHAVMRSKLASGTSSTSRKRSPVASKTATKARLRVSS